MLVTGAVLAVGLASAAGMHTVSAATVSGQQSLIDKIASKFNLNKNDVQAVFDQAHTEREAQHKEDLTNRLEQAVKDGSITEDQKTKILDKFDELDKQREAERTAFQDMTPAQRRAAMEKHRKELKQWAKDNGVPAKYLPIGGPPHGPDGPDDIHN